MKFVTSSFLSQISQFLSWTSNDLEKKATGCHRLVCISFCNKTAPVAKSLALVDNLKRSSSFGILRTRAIVKAFFSASKAFCCSTPQFQVQSFLVKSESGFDFLAKFSMNLQQKFAKPKNAYTCLTLVSTGYSRTPESFSSSMYFIFRYYYTQIFDATLFKEIFLCFSVKVIKLKSFQHFFDQSPMFL